MFIFFSMSTNKCTPVVHNKYYTICSNICRHKHGVLNKNLISSIYSDLELGDYNGRPLSVVTHAIEYTLQNFLIVVVMTTERLQKLSQATLHAQRPLRFLQLKASSYGKRKSFQMNKFQFTFTLKDYSQQVYQYMHQYKIKANLE